MDTSDKENVRSEKLLAQNVQQIWDTMRRPNLKRIEREEREEISAKGTENTFNKIIKKISLALRKRCL